MKQNLSRRRFLSSAAVAGAGVVSASVAVGADANVPEKIKIVVLNGSPRRDKTTASALTIAMEAARGVDPNRIDVELIHLVDYNLIANERLLGDLAVKEIPGKRPFKELTDKLAAPEVRGILVGSPTHNSSLSSLTALFFGQVPHAKGENGLFVLQGKAAGALAVGGARNGGQENVVNGINSYFFHEAMILPGAGPSGRVGGLLWNQKDSIDQDDFGKGLAMELGRRVAKTALMIPTDFAGE